MTVIANAAALLVTEGWSAAVAEQACAAQFHKGMQIKQLAKVARVACGPATAVAAPKPVTPAPAPEPAPPAAARGPALPLPPALTGTVQNALKRAFGRLEFRNVGTADNGDVLVEVLRKDIVQPVTIRAVAEDLVIVTGMRANGREHWCPGRAIQHRERIVDDVSMFVRE